MTRRAAIITSPTTLRFEWVTDEQQFLQLRDAWNALAPSAIQTIFLTHDWLTNWLRELAPDAELHVLTAWDGDRLVAALPLFGDPAEGRGRRWAIMGSGTLTPNHLDVIAEPALFGQARAGFAQLLLDASPMWDTLDFDKLPAEGGTHDVFHSAFAGAGLQTSSSDSAVCFVCELPETYEEYLAARSKATRKKIKETRRWLRKRDTVQLARVDTEEGALRALEALEHFHQARWEAKGYPGAFADARVRSFHQAEVCAALASGNLRMYTLSDRDQIIAVSYNYLIGSTAQAYLTSFDAGFSQSSPGVLLRSYVIEEVTREGATCFDWLEGAESYKKAWCDGERHDLRLRVYNRTLSGQGARLKHWAGTAVVLAARRWIAPQLRERVVQALARRRASRSMENESS